MKRLVICAAFATAVLAAPTFSQDGPFDHFTEVFDDNIAMPSAPGEIPPPDPSAVRFVPEHREAGLEGDSIDAIQPIRAPPGVRPQKNNIFMPRQPINPYYNYNPNFYPSPDAYYNPFQSQNWFFRDTQYPAYQPYRPQFVPQGIPYNQQNYQPIYVIPTRQQQPSFNQFSRPISFIFASLPSLTPADPVKGVAGTEDALITESQSPAKVAPVEPEKAAYTDKEFGSDKQASQGKIEKEVGADGAVDSAQEALQQEELIKLADKAMENQMVDDKPLVELDSGSGESPDALENDPSAPFSLVNFVPSQKSKNDSDDSKVVEAATSEEDEDLQVRNPPEPLGVFPGNSKDNEVLSEMLGALSMPKP